ncbi:MAG: phosphonate ABC transporter substrate-binding protein [Rubrivivax sp.]|nr:phosphonate ABC transporter substrate-binding protein [Rubrivivax sp.]
MDRRALLSIVATTATLWLGAAQAQSREIGFGIISTEASSNLKSAWQPLLDDMHKVTGLKINAFFATDYAGIIEGMRFNKVQVAWMGNKSGIEAVDRASAEVFAKIVGKDGTEGYYSLLVVHRDSPLKNLADVLKARASLTLGFGDPNSTSGTAVPGLYAFGMNQVDPLKDFKRTVRANHETNLLAVAGKQLDVATNNTEAIDRLLHTHPEKAAQVREIWRSPLIASDPMVWRRDLDEPTKKLVRDFILGYGRDAREQQILQKLGYSAFKASNNLQLVPVRQIELARERSRIEADSTLTADERARKLKDIDTRLAELGRQIASN